MEEKIKKLKLELIKKGQRIKELERELKKQKFIWRRYYFNKQWRENRK